ncbi:hypothetical protein JW962_02715 [Candidatus Dojkabacteria bacterium]|nr:hypothetical protein [Candidatus Dojkabacteria bacterium]
MEQPTKIDIQKIAKEISTTDQVAELKKDETKQEAEVKKVAMKEKIDYLDQKQELELNDILNRLKTRRWVAIVLFILLFLQNIAVFGLFVYVLLVTGIPTEKIDMFKIVLPIVIPATLGETAYAIKVIVEWLYKEVRY